nr:hypothetical protein BaRGS_026291 [Batillaria attramentaria]
MKGCSVRLLNPQTYSRNMWKILSVLQEYFNCSVGANVYLTPAGTQGFAPHYDDIEAFVIQLEGKKHWKLYSPRTDEENLPRFSSNNFTQSEVGTPILNVVLEAGDMLYFPRGTIHQANANEKEHSLHVTFSCYQRNTWGDLLERLVPRALQLAIEENVELRQGLPRDFLNYMGIVHSDKESTERKQFVEKVEGLVRSLVDYLPLDAACDQMGKQAIHDSLPPVLTEQEKACSIHGAGEFWEPAEMQVRGVVELEPDTEVRIIRRGVLRMLTEEDEVRIYHTLENARVYHGNTPQYFEISSEATPAVEFLIDSYPEYVPVDSLPLDTLQEKISVMMRFGARACSLSAAVVTAVVVLAGCSVAVAEVVSETKPLNKHDKIKYKDCGHLFKTGYNVSGVHELWMNKTTSFLIVCEFKDGNAFNVIQRRMDATTSFAMPLATYIAGFGNAQSNYWAGLNHISYLTSAQGNNVLTVHLTDWSGRIVSLTYPSFLVRPEENRYQMIVSGYSLG